MNDTRTYIIMFLFALVPYALVAWGYMALMDGQANDFWAAFGILLGVRLFFSTIETLGSVLAWRLYGKRLMVGKHLEFLRARSFPKRKFSEEDCLGYLSSIEDDPDQPASLRAAAKEMHWALATCEEVGIIVGMRMHSAAEAALEVYSPKAQAPAYGEGTA
jgi:hypothetical protein